MEYWEKSYCRICGDGIDRLSLSKAGDSDWAYVEMITNGNSNGKITLRSREAAEELRFMLDRLLDL